MKATVHFDGASLGNPGPSGAGAVLEVEGRPAKPLTLHLGRRTNNEAEYAGLILGLRHALAAGVDDVDVKGDSKLVVEQVKGTWAVKAEHLRPLRDEARKLLAQFRSHRISWVPRAQNEAADAASMKAALDQD